MSKTYTTVQGDMWDSIAYKRMGDVSYTDELMRLNQKHLDLYVFPVGVVLALPEPKESVSGSLPPWKRVVG